MLTSTKREVFLLINESFYQTDDSRLVISDELREVIIVFNYCIIGSCINIFGIITNVINIVVFYNMGLKDSVTISLVGLTVSDICSLTTLQWTSICYNPLFRFANIGFDSFEVEYITAGAPHVCFTRITGLITAFITIERCLCITVPLKVKTLLTPRRSLSAMVIIFVFMIGNAIPAYTVDTLGYKFYPSRNQSMIGLIFLGNREEVEKAAFVSSNIYCYVTFVVVVTCTVVLVMKLNNQGKWRQENAIENMNAVSANKDKRVIKMVIVLSATFVVCYLPVSAVFMGTIVNLEFGLAGRYENLYHVMCSICYNIESINSCVSIFIYTTMSSKYRAVFQRLCPRLSRNITYSNCETRRAI